MARLEYSAKYHPPWARSLCRHGLTLPEIAAEFGIARSTLCNWKKRYPEFSEAMEEGKGVADAKVEDSLFQRALGYSFEETRAHQGLSDGEMVTKKIERTTKHIPGDVTAMIFWLKNRCPGKWRDVQRMEHGGKVEVSHDPQIERLIEDPEAQRLLGELHTKATAGNVEGAGKT